MRLASPFSAALAAVIFAVLWIYAAVSGDYAAYKDAEEHSFLESEHRVEILKDNIIRLFYALETSLKGIAANIEENPYSGAELEKLLTIAALGNDDIIAFRLTDSEDPAAAGTIRFHANFNDADNTGERFYIYSCALSDGRILEILLDPSFLFNETYVSRFQGQVVIALKDPVSGNLLGGSSKALDNPRDILTVAFEGGTLDIYSKFAVDPRRFSPLNRKTAAKLAFSFILSALLYLVIRAIQKTADKNAVYKNVFDDSYSGLVIIKPDSGKILLMNTRGELTLGCVDWSREEISFYGYITGKYREGIVNELNSYGCVHYQHIKITDASGKEVWARIFIKLIARQTALVSFSDVDAYASSYIASVKELSIADFILNSLPAAFILTDPQGMVIRSNISAQMMLGLTSEEISETSVNMLFPPPFGERMLEENGDILNAKVNYYAGEYSFAVRGQSEKMYRVNKIPYLDADSRIIGVLSIFDDITEGALKSEELSAKLAEFRQAEKAVRTAAGENFSFIRRNAAERKRAERLNVIRTAGMGNMFKYISNLAHNYCKEVSAEINSLSLPEKNRVNILKTVKRIADLSFIERLFRFNEVPKLFSVSAMIKKILENPNISARLYEDETSKQTLVEAYPAELEEVFAKLMERLSALCGEIEISLSATVIEYTARFSFEGDNLSETLDNDIIFLYSWLFIKEILGEVWESDKGSPYTITVRFAV
jgi:PAS domain S-box-containing protein